jgi:arginyl-tRNA synthetase
MNLFGHFDGVVRAKLSDMARPVSFPAGSTLSKLVVEPPRDASHGDVTTNAAMVLAKPAGVRPRDLAQALAKRLAADPDIETAEVAGPGFVNLTLMQVSGPSC